jgi:hypothetical protein
VKGSRFVGLWLALAAAVSPSAAGESPPIQGVALAVVHQQGPGARQQLEVLLQSRLGTLRLSCLHPAVAHVCRPPGPDSAPPALASCTRVQTLVIEDFDRGILTIVWSCAGGRGQCLKGRRAGAGLVPPVRLQRYCRGLG